MHVALLTTRRAEAFADLTDAFDRDVITWTLLDGEDKLEEAARGGHDVVIIDMDGPFARPQAIQEMTAACHKDVYVPVLGLVRPGQLRAIEQSLGLDDFVLAPFDPAEVSTRLALLHARHRVRSSNEDELIAGDLRINLARYEVWVGIRQVALTFKEYELLRILASRPGHVFTRNSLLDVVWGYDYYGGTRTVDVHVRRLRSKIEDPSHTFVETVRNVGYRLRADPDAR